MARVMSASSFVFSDSVLQRRPGHFEQGEHGTNLRELGLQPSDRQLGHLECDDHGTSLRELGLQPSDRRLGHLERDEHVSVPPQLDVQQADRQLGQLERDHHASVYLQLGVHRINRQLEHLGRDDFGNIDRGDLLLSPLKLAATLDSLTHFAMINRPTLSSFHGGYRFTEPLTSEHECVPRLVIRELATFMALCPMLEGDLRRPWQDVLVATDASQSYG